MRWTENCADAVARHRKLQVCVFSGLCTMSTRQRLLVLLPHVTQKDKKMPTPISTDLDQPIIFRTTSKTVCENTLSTGSLWLRSDSYYRNIEDQARKDALEGINSGTTSLSLVFESGGVVVQMAGDGALGQQLAPHYILSMHGSAIAEATRQNFGGCTFGIRNLFKLTMEIFHHCSQQIACNGFRYGQVSYQRAALTRSRNSRGSAPIRMPNNPNEYLVPVDLDVLRKLPIVPLISQDEWRIAIFTDGYIDGDPRGPLKINVSTSHFFPY